MWSNVVTGLFTLTGLAVGVALEPLKTLFAAKARNRQQRAEQAAKVIQAASDAQHIGLQLNAAYRHRAAGFRVSGDQETEYITTYNAARDDLRKAVAMLRLHGPDALADEADKLRDADDAMFALLQEPDDGEHNLDTAPKRLKQATEVAAAAVQRFAKLARKHTA
ncbi:hypothetical protein [Lentzea sp. NPDC059081]|uniref:hypothetical protein n=1 Tax=Lentzea sp. NPDC059081 TaxID=3346719 RepID=UPI0036AD6346